MFFFSENLLVLLFIVLLVTIMYFIFLTSTHLSIIRFSELGVIFSLIIQFICVLLWLNYDPFMAVSDYNRGFQFFFGVPFNKILGITAAFGVDGVSLIFILLTAFIFSLSILFSTQAISWPNYPQFLVVLFILEFMLIIIFTVLDLFLFYVAFESSLIPMFLIIGIWGSRSRKIKAAFYLFIYTMATALLTLIVIFYVSMQVGSTFYSDLLNYNFTTNEQKALWICLFLTFATKIPIAPFHLWLPEAHVEAPTIGSVILASILLKLGGYGFFRFLIPLFPFASNFFLPFIYTLGICSIVFASLTTLRQVDLKRIIAYSSIAHMNMVVLGIFANNVQGLEGGLYLMTGHGFVSAGLFLLVGVVYDRYHTRLLRYYGGLIKVMPMFGLFFLLFTLGNVGFPGTSNFIGETLIMIGIFDRNPSIALFAGFGIILSAVYSFWLYNRIFFGTLKTSYIKNFIDVSRVETIVFFCLLFFILLVGINSNFILNICSINIKQLLVYSVV